jgi:hypothetical protein
MFISNPISKPKNIALLEVFVLSNIYKIGIKVNQTSGNQSIGIAENEVNIADKIIAT